MKKHMTVQEFASLGGKARWKGTNKKERSEHMRRVSLSRKSLQDKDNQSIPQESDESLD